MKRLDNESGKEFSYQADISTLEHYYQKQFEMIRKGNTDLVSLELVMLGNALDFMNFVKSSFGITLDGNEKSVLAFEEVLDALSRGIINKNLFDKQTGIAKNAGAYLGFLIIANIGGKWVDTNEGKAVVVSGREVYVMDFINKRLQNGSELNAAEYFKAVRTLKGAQP